MSLQNDVSREPWNGTVGITMFLAIVMMGIGLVGAVLWIGPVNIFDPMMAVPGQLVNIVLYSFMVYIGISGFWLMKVATKQVVAWATIVGLQASVRQLTDRLRTLEDQKGAHKNVNEQ